MKYSAAKIIELLGIVSVVASLIFVALELNQANTLAERESRQALTDINFELNRMVLENPSLVSLMPKLRSLPTNLSPEEYELAQFLSATFINYWGAVSASYESGQVPYDVLQSYLEHIGTILSEYPGLKTHVEFWLSENKIDEGSFAVFDRVWQEIGT